jgi:Glycosyltransferase
MACGLPVLHSGNGGVPELTGPKAGVGLGCPADWETLRPPTAEAIGGGMVAIAKTYESMGRAARDRTVERFDLKPWIRRHQEVFQALLNESAI